MRNPNVPEALEGWYILHRLFRFDRQRWEQIPGMQRDEMARQAMTTLNQMHNAYDSDAGLVQVLGHKADLMITHYARSFEALAAMQTKIDRLSLCHFLRQVGSYVSILELGLYEATARFHTELAQRGLEPQSEEWAAAFDELLLEESREPRNGVRLWAKIPNRRHACFYPMSRRRGEEDNWYTLSYDERLQLMREHGKVGRSYSGQVTQVISGSIGLDDWEWGVDLYADDPAVFKRLVYEMRFDEVSARYGHFGPFYVGLQFSISELLTFCRGDVVPKLLDEPVPSSGNPRWA